MKDDKNIPPEDRALLGLRAYERLGHDVVPRAFELLNRLGTIAYARAHTLGVYARPRGVALEPGVRDGLVARAMSLLGLNKFLEADPIAYYKFSKLFSGQAIAQPHFAYDLPSGVRGEPSYKMRRRSL